MITSIIRYKYLKKKSRLQNTYKDEQVQKGNMSKDDEATF